jgi:hypothetical protein
MKNIANEVDSLGFWKQASAKISKLASVLGRFAAITLQIGYKGLLAIKN